MQEKTHTYTTRTITDLKPGDHLCQIYETEEEHRKLLTPYLIQGLRNNEKVFYIVDTHTAEVILEYLNSEGFNPNPYLDSGQFSIITRNEAYVKEGNFDPDRMIELLRSETQKAIKEGYGALRVTGEMTWALRGLPGSEKLIEYEAKLNDFFPKEVAEKYRADDKRTIEIGATEDIEERYIQDGEETWVHTLKTPMKDENGKVIGVLGIFQDISERKKSEEILRESEEKYKTVVEGALNGICMIGGDYRFKYVNEKLAEIQGYSREELIGTDLRDYLDEESRTLLADRAAQQKKGIKLSAHFQLNIIRKDGEVKTTEISARNIKDSKGDVNTIVILKDITERKKAKKELEASKANFLNIVENSIDGVIVVDQQGKIHYVNPVAESFFLGKKRKLWGEIFGFPLVADEMAEIDIFHKNAGKGVTGLG